MKISYVKLLKSRYLRYVFYGLSAILACTVLFAVSIYAGAWGKLPGRKALSDLKYQKASEVYTADSILIGKYYLHDRQPIAYEDFPPHLIDALVAIEDERFYDHSGVDYKSVFRVAIKSLLLQDDSSGGGSTISQQLAKNLYPRQRSGKIFLAVDKIREMIIARRLERIYSKQEVLQHYLNTVSFGDNTYGIESASLKFFDKKARALNVEEAATLVGMLKATYGYNPRIFPDDSFRRRNLVLSAMVSNEYLEKDEGDSLRLQPLELHYREFDYNEGLAPYFREEVRKQLLRWSTLQGESDNAYNIYTSGLKIYTTLDYKMQQLAEEAMTTHMSGLQQAFEKSYGSNAPWLTDDKLIEKAVRNSPVYKALKAKGLGEEQLWDSLQVKKSLSLNSWEGEHNTTGSAIDSIKHYMKFLNTGSLSIDPSTGAVKTWIGGVNFKYFKYDHISQSKRQVGSAFKPIVYTAALEQGISPCTYFSAREMVYENLEDWAPENTGDKDEAYLNYSMEEALSNSVNTVAVKVLEKTGIPNVLSQAEKMGITAELPRLPSLALGTGEIGIDELAGAYASYVNSGKAVKPFLIRHIADDRDSILETFKPQPLGTPAFSEDHGAMVLEMMKTTIDRGTAARIRHTYGLRNDIAGKTGTTQNNKDAWFVAVMPKLVHVTWVGLENHEIGFKSTELGQGANAALPIFALWLKKMNQEQQYRDLTAAKFPEPGDGVRKALDCEPVKRDGFFTRLFKNPDRKKTKKFRDKD